MMTVTLDDIEDAQEQIRSVHHRTPLFHSTAFSRWVGGEVYLKLENLQKTGSFKIRGAYNRLSRLTPKQAERGVVAASAGNHAQGVALAARQLGIDCTIVMPRTAPITKVIATRNYGARVLLKGDSFDVALEHARSIEDDEGQVFIHAFDDLEIIAGQGTVGLEIAEQLPEVDTVVVPVGGGGLIAGIATAVKARLSDVRVVGVEPETAASMYRSSQAGRLVTLKDTRTIADGLAVKHPAQRTLDIQERLVDELVTVDEDAIAHSILQLLERAKLMVEGGGAVSLAAVLHQKVDVRDDNVAVVVSGGNIDVNILSRIIERGLMESGRYLRLRTTIPDRPGMLLQLLEVVAEHQVNVLSIYHDRLDPDVTLAETHTELMLEMQGRDHIAELTQALQEEGYQFEIL